MGIISNSEYWNILQSQGRLYSSLKDGVPENRWEQLLGFAYPVTLGVIIALCVIVMLKLPSERRLWKSFIFSVSSGTVIGAIGCFFTYKSNAAFPGWLFPPWAITGIEFGLTLEDWLFLPACTALFYTVYRFIDAKNDPFRPSSGFHYGVIAVYMAIALLAVLFLRTAGRLEIAIYLIPGIALYWLSKDYIPVKKFLILQVFVLVFQTSWDLISVSLLHMIPGLAWASQWIYVSFDNAGNAFHSPAFMEYSTHRWAWILYNPIEMTPLFGICGGLLNCALFATGDKLFYPGKTVRSTV